ncbi:MAG: hypothetical protein Q9183_003447 [Haloplaca sp. 2 TL-2023]
MEPLGVTASLATIIELAIKATTYLREVKYGSEDRIKLRDEIRSTQYLLETLKDRVDDSLTLKKDLASIRALTLLGGPLDQFNTALEQLIDKIAPKDGFARRTRSLVWPFKKEDVRALLDTIERQKSAFSLALQNDHMYCRQVWDQWQRLTSPVASHSRLSPK